MMMIVFVKEKYATLLSVVVDLAFFARMLDFE